LYQYRIDIEILISNHHYYKHTYPEANLNNSIELIKC